MELNIKFTKSPGAILDAAGARRVAGRTPAIKSTHPDQFIPDPSGLLRQPALSSLLYPDHKWPADSSTASAMYLVRQRGQAPLPQ